MFVIHQVKNFPTKITSKWILKKHVTRIIWAVSAQHSVVNYPADHIAALTPNTPTKLYNDDRVGGDHYGVYNLPRRVTAGVSLYSGECTTFEFYNFIPGVFTPPSRVREALESLAQAFARPSRVTHYPVAEP